MTSRRMALRRYVSTERPSRAAVWFCVSWLGLSLAFSFLLGLTDFEGSVSNVLAWVAATAVVIVVARVMQRRRGDQAAAGQDRS